MEKIRISSGVQKIEVNDEGETILLPVSDDGFIVAFYKLLDRVQTAAQSIPQTGEDIAGNMEAVETVVALEQELREKVDGLFGPETCRKVFGPILPSMDLFVEFFGSLLPFIEAHRDKRLAKMSKYDAGRTGTL